MSSQKTNRRTIQDLLEGIAQFETEAHAILGKVESSRSRVVNLAATYKKLAGLSLNQDELFQQALSCAEYELYRAAHVMAWAGFMDFLDEKTASDGFIKLHAARTNWTFSTTDDLREKFTEYARVEAVKAIGLCNKTEMKAYHGLLNKRNESAHPSTYYPDLNETLGYISELLKRITDLQNRTL